MSVAGGEVDLGEIALQLGVVLPVHELREDLEGEGRSLLVERDLLASGCRCSLLSHAMLSKVRLEVGEVGHGAFDRDGELAIVDVLLDDISSELTEDPEIDLLKNLEGMPQPVNDEDMTIDDAFSSDLDLARAYIEIDEIREAQKLLKKVLAKGSSEQQDEAKHILEQLENL